MEEKILNIKGITYDDILIIPGKFELNSRNEISTETYFTRRLKINIPIISSPMDSVTESKMAIAIAKCGGVGIIHRFMSIEEQVKEVEKVKRARSLFIENPYTIYKGETLKNLKKLIKETGTKSILVVDEKNKLVGIVTNRDIRFETDLNKKVEEIMTTREKLIVAKENISFEEAEKIMKEYKLEKIPVVDEDFNIKGLITAKSILEKINYPNASQDKKGRLMVGAAIGVRGDYLERAEKLFKAEVDFICIDVAHGHANYCINAIKQLRKQFGDDIEIMAGNVATYEGYLDLAYAGADSIRVGIGSGSICITRIVTGSGVPQATAILECAKAAEKFYDEFKYYVPIIADGGIRNGGDIAKAIGLGAFAVMVGNLLAGTDEAPGMEIIRNGKKFKMIRGMASLEANLYRKLREGYEISEEEITEFLPEGVDNALVPYKGSVEEVIKRTIKELKSGMAYAGAKNIEEMRKKAKFIRISEASYKESLPHDIILSTP